QVDLVGEAPPEPVTEETGDECTDRHAHESERYELQILRERGKLAADGGRQHAAGDIEVIAVEEHAGPDQPKYAVVERAGRQAVETSARVDRCRHEDLPLDQSGHPSRSVRRF